MKRVYVASPYTKLIADHKKSYVRYVALQALKGALNLADDESRYWSEFFSPVLFTIDDENYEDISWQEAMKLCFDELKRCDVLFIPEEPFKDKDYIYISKGIRAEIRFALVNGIEVVYESSKMANKFKKLKGIG